MKNIAIGLASIFVSLSAEAMQCELWVQDGVSRSIKKVDLQILNQESLGASALGFSAEYRFESSGNLETLKITRTIGLSSLSVYEANSLNRMQAIVTDADGSRASLICNR